MWLCSVAFITGESTLYVRAVHNVNGMDAWLPKAEENGLEMPQNMK